MMHPSRQAYVEEEFQVRNLPHPHFYAPRYSHLPRRLDHVCWGDVWGRLETLTEMGEMQDTEMGVDLANIRKYYIFCTNPASGA